MKHFFMLMAMAMLISCGQGNQANNTDDGQQAQMKIAAGLGNAPKMEPTEVLNLYEGKAPGTESWTNVEDYTDETKETLFNITTPTLAVYLPDPSIATGSAMVVCPGGGFYILSYVSEGIKVAEELCMRGIAAFVLKYRTHPIGDENADGKVDGQDLTIKSSKVMGALSRESASAACLSMEYSHLAFQDADRAVSMVRQNAAKWGINPDKIGIVGFSAGAVTSMHQVLEHSEAGKPNFGGIIYGGWTHDVKAPADAAPVFLCAPVNDIFYPEESQDVYMAWREAKVPVELHYYSDSQHGFGAVPTGKSSDLWIDEMVRFMRDVQF
jgi:acetyl esterase/lipase